MMVRVLVDAREFANMVAHAARVLERDNPYVALDAADDGLATVSYTHLTLPTILLV